MLYLQVENIIAFSARYLVKFTFDLSFTCLRGVLYRSATLLSSFFGESFFKMPEIVNGFVYRVKDDLTDQGRQRSRNSS